MSLLLHTPGEPGGIGIECLLKISQKGTPACRVALTDPALLAQQAQALNLPVTLQPYPGQPLPTPAGTLYYEAVGSSPPSRFGQCLEAHGALQLRALDRAVEMLSDRSGALITGPVQKSALARIQPEFRGHTEYLATQAGVDRVVMMLACPTLRVALVTTHLPLREVPDALATDDILRCLEILQHDLQQHFQLPRPRIACCGLNPHAGEDGLLGREEIDIIQPALEQARKRGMDVSGPWPADTIFTPRRLTACDAVLAMYHDQGLPTLKYAGFGNAVNVTLGLPFVRTSVDHGTGLDIAGQGVADAGSLKAAEHMALQMTGVAA